MLYIFSYYYLFRPNKYLQKNITLPYLYVSKEYLVFTYAIFPNYIQCPLNIYVFNTYEYLHDSFLISIFNNYYLPYVFVWKGILRVYLRHLMVHKLNIFSIYNWLNTCESLHNSFILISKHHVFCYKIFHSSHQFSKTPFINFTISSYNSPPSNSISICCKPKSNWVAIHSAFLSLVSSGLLVWCCFS